MILEMGVTVIFTNNKKIFMKRIFFIGILTILASCSDNAAKVEKTSVALTTTSEENSKKEADKINYGEWKVTIENTHSNTRDSLKIVIAGRIDLERPNAKVVLMVADDEREYPGELMLKLSKRPRKTMDQPAGVAYSEAIRKLQYKKIVIMYRRDTVAILNNIIYPG